MKRFIARIGVLLNMIQAGWLMPLSAQDISLDIVYGGIEDAEAILQE